MYIFCLSLISSILENVSATGEGEFESTVVCIAPCGYVCTAPREVCERPGSWSVAVRTAYGSAHSSCRQCELADPVPHNIVHYNNNDGAGSCLFPHLTFSNNRPVPVDNNNNIVIIVCGECRYRSPSDNNIFIGFAGVRSYPDSASIATASSTTRTDRDSRVANCRRES